jgi:hypothetical protein
MVDYRPQIAQANRNLWVTTRAGAPGLDTAPSGLKAPSRTPASEYLTRSASRGLASEGGGVMTMQRRRDLQAAMVTWAALLMSISAVPSRADSLIVGPTDEGTRLIAGTSPPTLDHPWNCSTSWSTAVTTCPWIRTSNSMSPPAIAGTSDTTLCAIRPHCHSGCRRRVCGSS